MALPERDSPRGGSSAVTQHLQNSKKTLPCGWRVPQCSLSSVLESTGCQKTNAFFSSKLFLLQMLSISIWEAFSMSNSYCWSVGGLAKYQLSPRNSSPYCFRSHQDSSQAGRGKECAARSKFRREQVQPGPGLVHTPLFPPETCLDEGIHRGNVPPDDCLLFQLTLEVNQICGKKITHIF